MAKINIVSVFRSSQVRSLEDFCPLLVNQDVHPGEIVNIKKSGNDLKMRTDS